MSADVTVTKHAANSGGMSFRQLCEFVEAAKRSGVPDGATVLARISMGGKLKQITASAPAAQPEEES